MFCPKCGKELVDGAVFCAGCGTKLDFLSKEAEIPADETSIPEENVVQDTFTQPEEEYRFREEERSNAYDVSSEVNEYYDDQSGTGKKKGSSKNRKPLIIGLCTAAAVIVVLGILIFTGVLFPKNELTLLNAANKTSEAVNSRSEISGFIRDLSNSGKAGFDLKVDNAGELIASLGGSIVPGLGDAASLLSLANISLEINAAADKKGNLSGCLDLDLMGSEIKAGIYSSSSGDGDIAVSMPIVLDQNYGVSLKTFEKDLDESVFAPGSGSEYELSRSDFENLKKAISTLKNYGNASDSLDITGLVTKLYTDSKTKVKLTKKNEETDCGDGVIKCTAYTANIDQEKALAILESVKEWFLNTSVKDADSNIFVLLEITDKLDDIIETVLNYGFNAELKFYVYNSYLVKADAVITLNNKDLTGSISFGSDPKTSKAITASFQAGGHDGTAILDLSKAEDNTFTLSLYSDGNSMENAAYFWYDKKTSYFECGSDFASFYISGYMDLDNKEIKFSNPVFSVNGMELPMKGLSWTVTKDADIRKVTDDFSDGYVNILKLSEKDISDILSQFENLYLKILELMF